MPETILTLERTSDAPREARRQVRNLAPPGRVDDAMLLVSELVTNAVKYGPEEQIRLIVSDDGARTRFTVHDAGLGPLQRGRPLARRARPAAGRRAGRRLGRRARKHPGLVRARPVR
jgi:anti-sigma regulatory factor (Ser/Thr protein kinase)